MRKIIFIYIIAFNLIFSLPISENFAIEISENFYYSKNDRRISSFSVEYTETYINNNDNVFYIIHLNPEGFILISADNFILPVLGYSFENNYSSNDIPTNIEYLFNLYSKQMIEQREESNQDNYIGSQWEKFSNLVEYESQNRSVSPLISARFDQGTPWNDMCPEDSEGPGGNVLVGCVAVSMAQIMHYWSYPATGYGSHGYTHGQYGYQYVDFSNATYDYDDMPSNYGTPETAKLLYHAGVAVHMDYSPWGSGASVCWDGPSAQNALDVNFQYNDNITCEVKINYSDEEWELKMKDQLDRGWPMVYRGYSEDAGHAWNIDGYQNILRNNYFHCNWGWGGSANGYFYFDNLNGGGYNFIENQAALLNIIPDNINPPVALFEFSIEDLGNNSNDNSLDNNDVQDYIEYKAGNLDEHQYMLYVQLKESIGESHCRNIGELNQAF